MKILSIETSCDETAISVLGFLEERKAKVLFDSTLSQVELHKKYGGVYPVLAKRLHSEKITLLFKEALEVSGFLKKREKEKTLTEDEEKKLSEIFLKDETNLGEIKNFYKEYEIEGLDGIAVTYGPGLEIALWVGFNFARAMSFLYQKKLIPVDHMEGHIFSSLIKTKKENIVEIEEVEHPFLALLISGGHTDLILSDKNLSYKKIGGTLDDAVGEAYDKTARLLGLEYPGGPKVSALSEIFKKSGRKNNVSFPRPMLNQDNYNFSFSGLKTAVLYHVKDREIKDEEKEEICNEFENSVSEVLFKKTKKFIQEEGVSSLIIGGGVSANDNLRNIFKEMEEEIVGLKVYLPEKKYTGDNALMIGVAAYFREKNNTYPKDIKSVNGNLDIY